MRNFVEIFFMEKDKANERSSHLMVSDYRQLPPPTTPCITNGATGALPAYKGLDAGGRHYLMRIAVA